MPTAKQMVVLSLKDLAHRCLREQMKLKVIRATRRTVEADEAATYRRIKSLKSKIDRELVVSAKTLGLPDMSKLD